MECSHSPAGADELYQLPALLTPTIGREHEIEAVSAQLQRVDVRLLTLTGPGGVGKTRLALEVARGLRADFPDGVCFISLAALVEHEQILATIARRLGVEEMADVSLFKRLCQYLHTRRVLLVLDNFEHLLAGATLIAELLQETARLKVLATSREVLHLYGEHEYAVPPLALPEVVSAPGEMPVPVVEVSGPAVALFVERARAVRPAFALSTENQQAVAEICMHLDGLPLAIELAAARIKLLSAQEVLTYLEKRFQLLTNGARNLPPRQRSLRNTLDWSYNLLSEPEKRFFRYLGVLVGSWTLEAAAHIAGGEGVNAEDPLELLTSLVDKSLVRAVEEMPGEMRFLLLETIHEYALECLQAEGELPAARHAHAQFYTQVAEEGDAHLYGREQRQWVRRLDREAPNLWAALRWTIEQADTTAGLRLASALVGYWQVRGSLSEGRNWFAEVLALPGAQQESRGRACVLYAAGLVAHKRHELELARERLEESRRLAGALGERRVQALVLGSLSMLDLHQGESTVARARAEEGVRLLHETDDPWCRGILHRICADISCRQCDFQNARVRYRVSLMLLREAGDLRGEMETLVNFANMVRLWGRVRIASALYQRGLRLFEEIDDRRGQLACLLGIGTLLHMQGSYEEAQAYLERCLALATALGDICERAAVMCSLGQLALARGDLERAVAFLKESVRLNREAGYSSGIWLALLGLGDCALNQGRLAEAGRYYEQCFALATKIENKLARALSMWGLGTVAALRQELARACPLLKQSLHLCWEMDTKLGLISTCEALALLCRRLKQPERAAYLLGIAAGLRDAYSAPVAPGWRAFYDTEVAAIRAAAGEAAFHEAWGVGRNMELRQTIGLVAHIHVPESVPEEQERNAEKSAGTHYPAGLTAREVDVLRLLASGLTDALIAQQLVLSPRTVNTHLRSIYGKLGVSTRSAATRVALERGIVD